MGNALGDGRRALSKEVPVGYKRTEVGVIPEEWNAHPLRDDISLLSGHHVLARNYNIRGDGTPYMTGPADFSDGRIKQTKCHRLTTKPTTICRAGDILVTVKGSGSGTLVEADTEYCISRQLMAIRTTAWNPTFLLYSLLQNASRIKAASTGLIPGLSRSDILDQTIPVPNDTTEQCVIAEALSDVDKLLGALETLIAKKRAIKQAAMQQLLTGKTRLPGFSGVWEIGKLAEFGVFRSGNGFPLVFQGRQSGDYPFFKVSDINNKGNELLLKSANHWISEDVRRTLGATKFSAGSIVFAKIGAAIFLERKRLLSRESCLDNNMMAFSLTAPGSCEQFFHYLFLRIELGKLVSTTALPSCI